MEAASAQCMTPSERLALTLALQPALAECLEGVDLLLSCVSAAAHHYRRASACTPFPSIGPATAPPSDSPAQPDYRGLAALLDALPPVRHLIEQPDSLGRLPERALRLLQWLLLHSTRRRRFAVVTPAQVMGVVGDTAVAGLCAALAEATVVLELLSDTQHQQLQLPALQQNAKPVWALHGTSFENMHSILHNGLLNLSGTYLQRTGAAFGNGIYLAREYTTAASFSAAQQGWCCSALGARLRAVLLCEVAVHAQQALEQGCVSALRCKPSQREPAANKHEHLMDSETTCSAACIAGQCSQVFQAVRDTVMQSHLCTPK